MRAIGHFKRIEEEYKNIPHILFDDKSQIDVNDRKMVKVNILILVPTQTMFLKERLRGLFLRGRADSGARTGDRRCLALPPGRPEDLSPAQVHLLRRTTEQIRACTSSADSPNTPLAEPHRARSWLRLSRSDDSVLDPGA